MTRKRVRQTVVEQLSLRLYAESPRDVWIADALRPLSTGMLRATIIEALYEGLHLLKKKGWNIGEKPETEDKASVASASRPKSGGNMTNLSID